MHDLIDNPSPRCPCLLVLDTSGSMDGEPIRQLNFGVQSFIQALQNDEVAACSVEVAILAAGGHVEEILPFTTVMDLDYTSTFTAQGGTPLGMAVEKGLDMLEKRKSEYQKNGIAYYQPWLVMISDGAPTDAWQSAAQNCRTLSENKKLVSLMVGVEDADMDKLGQFSNRPALKLDGLRFGDFFQWLSASMSRVSSSNSTATTVNLPPIDSWASI
ncbi:VWA domain-containing protein [Conchiformibius steedae DSM 2580]|uniref:VWA domain-containing protein n=2 Tax=Conchiformibius steedae TaxID=153493 RepID=A0A3P2AA39_9NEIS|nr:VWA domain-containing protein [Conchiformibius steedae]QMT32875.1 VWA domain-containing protein [Conchiformibius steedae]RRD91626.1 VWA domain-containing protein [Conchiformibius steedae]URD67489.1 VWA domain-containing protein [Conchiformibius steedae DSM 2580]